MTRRGIKGQRLVVLFLLGCVLFSQPLLSLFNKVETVLGIPAIYAYVFAAWALFIALTVAIIEKSR